MRLSARLTIIFGAAILAAALLIGYMVSRPRGPVLVDTAFGAARITPNADGDGDITTISYRLRREAIVSIYFTDENGDDYYFRREETRVRGEYEVLFGGTVDGYELPGEEIEGEVLSRLLTDGDYTWTVEAYDVLTERADRIHGDLIVADADALLPDLWDFSISPPVFTPNQDGLTDRVYINMYIPKDAELVAYLADGEGERYYLTEFQQERNPGEEGRHIFEWDGGVELGREPPPDGEYTVIVESMDEEGQQVVQGSTLTIRDGGVPLAEIVAQPTGDTLRFSSETVVEGDILYFEVTIWNYGAAPIRTTGPEPGYIYEQTDLFSSAGFYEESGAWRLGIHCETCLNDYPWRWAIASRDELTPIEINGQTQYYLMPGQRAVVTGGIRLTEIIEGRNPQQFWAGLIHEDVGISNANNRVDAQWIEIAPAAQ